MNSYTVFNNQIARIKGILLKRALQWFLVYTILFYYPLASITLVTHRIGLLYGDRNVLFVMNLVISFLLALLLVVKKRGSLMDELIGMDDRLRLQSRLSTAYEYNNSREESIFKDLLIKEASHLLRSIHPREMFPRVLNRVHLLIPIFIMLFVISLFWDFFSYPFKKEYIEDPALQRISEKIKDFIKKESQTIEGKEIQPHGEPYRALEELVKRIDGQALNRDTLMDDVRVLAQLIQAGQKSAARRIRTTLNPGDISRTPILKPLESQKMNPDEVSKMEEFLKDLFQGKIPAEIAKDISSIEDNNRVLQFLDQILDELQANGKISKSPLLKGEEMGVAAGVSRPDKESEDQKPFSKGAVAGEKGTNFMQGYSPFTGQGMAGKSRERGDSGNGELNEPFYPQAGNARASGRQNPPGKIKGSEAPAIREQGISMPGERYNAQVRSLTAIGNPKINKTEVLRVYEREVEEILKKEDIPVNYRLYIKNYFLSIGIGREDNANERTE